MLTLHIVRSGMDGWTWGIYDGAKMIDAGSSRNSDEARSDGKRWLAWHLTRMGRDTVRRSYSGFSSFGE